MRIGGIPSSYRGLYRWAMAGRSRRAAIRAHCLMCCGWQYVEVENCPLYPYRLGAAMTEFEAEPAADPEPAECL